MTRWLDKPSMDSDEIIDLVIERSQRFFSRYASPCLLYTSDAADE